MAAAEYACNAAEADSLHSERQALALFQHHDGITGTAKSVVVQDYFQTMQHAMDSLRHKISTCVGVKAHGSGKVLFNPTGLERDGLGPWEVKQLLRPLDEYIDVEPASADNYSPSPRVTVGRDGHISAMYGHQVVETLAWTNNKGGHDAGAYLMAVQGNSESLRLKHSGAKSVRGSGGGGVEVSRSEALGLLKITSHFDMVSRTVFVPDDENLPLRFEFAVDIRSRNNGELWASYRMDGIDSTAQQLCADVHGIRYECHSPRFSAPLQAQFYPMPTMAWQARSFSLMTFCKKSWLRGFVCLTVIAFYVQLAGGCTDQVHVGVGPANWNSELENWTHHHARSMREPRRRARPRSGCHGRPSRSTQIRGHG